MLPGNFEAFLVKHKRLIFLSSTLLILLMGFIVMQARPLDLNEGLNPNWWEIIHNLEVGNGYKGCETSYFPGCDATAQITAIREPVPVFLYALFAKLSGDSPKVLQFQQVLYNLLTLLPVFFLGKELHGTTTGLLAAMAWATYLPVLRVEAHLNGDVLAALLVTTGTLMFVRATRRTQLSNWLGFGLFFGLAILTRTATMLVAFALVGGYILYLGWKKSRAVSTPAIPIRHILISIGLLVVTVSPWVIRNWIAFSEPVIGTTLIGYNLYRHNSDVTVEVMPHYVGSNEATVEIEAFIAQHPELLTPLNEAQADRIYRDGAIARILANPEEYIELFLYRFLPLWFNIGVLEQYNKSMTILDRLIVFQQLVLLFLFLVGVRKGDWLTRLIAFSILIFVLSYMAVDSQLRYMLPVAPLVVIVGVLGLVNFWPRLVDMSGFLVRLVRFERN
jgi:4-amino-4-deoxy-L-arabinose transferase-like glycosyltransferase